jgi:hypothetical protein
MTLSFLNLLWLFLISHFAVLNALEKPTSASRIMFAGR